MNQNLIDRAEFKVRGGSGGDGAIAFAHESKRPKGGPNGGDGGDGASVIMRASRHVATLRAYAGKDAFLADKGNKGSQFNRTGKNAEDIILDVPVGTLVLIEPATARLLPGRTVYGEDVDLGKWSGKRVDSVKFGTFDERWPHFAGVFNETYGSKGEYVQVMDLNEDGKEIVLAAGGRGGIGNTKFKSSTYTTPKIAQRGEKGERFRVRLELKVLADVGLVGEPNVGKSTLLSVITKARPEIADYAFTTLSPNLGVLETKEVEIGRKSIVLADIPGLIEDAHTGKGLGIDFLRHIERCKALVYMLAPTAADLDRKPDDLVQALWHQYETILHELTAYGRHLEKKPKIVVLNKTDLITSALPVIQTFFSAKKIRLTLISTASHDGVPELIKQIWKLVE